MHHQCDAEDFSPFPPKTCSHKTSTQYISNHTYNHTCTPSYTHHLVGTLSQIHTITHAHPHTGTPSYTHHHVGTPSQIHTITQAHHHTFTPLQIHTITHAHHHTHTIICAHPHKYTPSQMHYHTEEVILIGALLDFCLNDTRILVSPCSEVLTHANQSRNSNSLTHEFAK